MSSPEAKWQEALDNTAVLQVADICKKAVSGKMEIYRDGASFSIERSTDTGGGIVRSPGDADR